MDSADRSCGNSIFRDEKSHARDNGGASTDISTVRAPPSPAPAVPLHNLIDQVLEKDTVHSQ